MTTLNEFIEYLKGLPPETEISVIEAYDCGYATCTREVPLNIDEITGNVEFTDLTGNRFIKSGSSSENKKTLTLGRG